MKVYLIIIFIITFFY